MAEDVLWPGSSESHVLGRFYHGEKLVQKELTQQLPGNLESLQVPPNPELFSIMTKFLKFCLRRLMARHIP